MAFDALGAPATASEMTLSFLFHPARAERLVQQHALDKDLPGLDYVLNETISKTIKKEEKDEYMASVQKTINYVVFQHLLNLAVNDNSTPLVKSIANQQIDELANWLRGRNEALSKEMYRNIKRFREEPEKFRLKVNVPRIPDGSPIGD